MNLEDCLLVKKQLHCILEKNSKEGDWSVIVNSNSELTKCSKDIFFQIYSEKSIGYDEQVLLYLDDIVFLDVNYENFRKEYFVTKLESWAIASISAILGKRQYGEFIVLTKETANKILKQAKLKTFKK